MREFKLNDPRHPEGGPTIIVKYDEDCVFCKHCTDIFWDYTHGPYMMRCEFDHDTTKRPCPYFDIFKKIDSIIEAEKQIMESNCQILEDINEAEKKIKECTNDKKTTI